MCSSDLWNFPGNFSLKYSLFFFLICSQILFWLGLKGFFFRFICCFFSHFYPPFFFIVGLLVNHVSVMVSNLLSFKIFVFINQLDYFFFVFVFDTLASQDTQLPWLMVVMFLGWLVLSAFLKDLSLLFSSSFSPPCLDSLASSSSPPAFCVLVEVA